MFFPGGPPENHYFRERGRTQFASKPFKKSEALVAVEGFKEKTAPEQSEDRRAWISGGRQGTGGKREKCGPSLTHKAKGEDQYSRKKGLVAFRKKNRPTEKTCRLPPQAQQYGEGGSASA